MARSSSLEVNSGSYQTGEKAFAKIDNESAVTRTLLASESGTLYAVDMSTVDNNVTLTLPTASDDIAGCNYDFCFTVNCDDDADFIVTTGANGTDIYGYVVAGGANSTVDDFDGSKLRSGESILETKSVLEQHNPDAVLINCSRPEAVTLAVRIISQLGFKFGAYANGFTKITDEFLEDAPTVSSLKRRKDLSPKEYLKFVYEWINLGATIVGGCCEVGPEHIKLIAEDLTKSGYQIG